MTRGPLTRHRGRTWPWVYRFNGPADIYDALNSRHLNRIPDPVRVGVFHAADSPRWYLYVELPNPRRAARERIAPIMQRLGEVTDLTLHGLLTLPPDLALLAETFIVQEALQYLAERALWMDLTRQHELAAAAFEPVAALGPHLPDHIGLQVSEDTLLMTCGSCDWRARFGPWQQGPTDILATAHAHRCPNLPPLPGPPPTLTTGPDHTTH